jgi:voltage-gated potassium channel
MWWAIETITTVGYGDIVPVTLAGRILAGMISVIGIGTLALFSGLITAGYLNQLRLLREQHHGASKLHKSAGSAAHQHQSAGGLDHATCPHCGGHLLRAKALDGAPPIP